MTTATLTTDHLLSLPLFANCGEEDVAAIAAAATEPRTLGEGEVICAEGDIADRWWIVVRGLADVTVEGLYIATIGPGETIGELGVLDGQPRAATVTAVTDLRVYEIDGETFVQVLLDSPRLAMAMLRQLAGRLRATNRRPVGPPPVAPVAPAVSRPGIGNGGAGRSLTPFDPGGGFFDDPVGHVAALREAGPLHWSEALSSWVVTRYDDVRRLSRSRSLIGSVATMEPPDTSGQTPHRPGWRMMIARDGDDHTRLRKLVSRVFTPRAVTAWQQRAESIVERLLAAADERDQLDVIADYAFRLPAQVITEMLGMPADDTPQLRAWSRALTMRLDPFITPEQEEAAAEAGRGMYDYVQAVIAEKRARPGEDILTALLEAEEDGDMLDDREVLNQVILIYIAGHETTLNLIGNGVTHLFRFPEQLDRLRTTPDLDANAIEEVLRYEGPAQLTRRVNLEPVEVGGTTIPANSHITLSLASANHDPRRWGPTADVLDIARPGANDHVSFGGGAHYCLGASLARMEARIALPRLLRRFPRMAPAYDTPQWIRRSGLRGVETLPVVLRETTRHS